MRRSSAIRARFGTVRGEIDFALLLDGLEAEREQGITIDVAYRYFATPRRAFIVADTPGHEQYTRNMATGASNAELAVLLVDARKGLLGADAAPRHHRRLLGIRHVVLAVNKIDLVGLRPRGVRGHRRRLQRASPPSSASRTSPAIPMSARYGDNVSARSGRMPWYAGPPLLAHLESVDVEDDRAGQAVPLAGAMGQPAAFRFPRLCRHGRRRQRQSRATRSWCCRRARATRVKSIVTADGELAAAQAGDAVTVTLADEIDVARGDMLARAARPPGGRRPVRRASGLDGGGQAASRAAPI